MSDCKLHPRTVLLDELSVELLRAVLHELYTEPLGSRSALLNGLSDGLLFALLDELPDELLRALLPSSQASSSAHFLERSCTSS